MPLKGGLREFSLPDLFQLIHFGKKNGTLVITNGDSKGYVCFRNGNIFFATHNWRRPPLGERLVQAGMVTDEQVHEALDLQRASGKEQRLGNILCELGHLSRESLEVFVEEQIRDAVFNLLRWTEGEFDFDPDEIFPEEDIGLSMSTEDLILEGSRRMDEWYQLEKKVPSLDSVFKMIKEPGKDASDMNLTSDEWLVLYHIDGESAVRDIVEKSGQSVLVTCRALYGLVTAGLVSLAGEVHITPAVEDVDFEDEVVQLKEGKASGRRAVASVETSEDRLQKAPKETDKSVKRGRKRSSRAEKKVSEYEEEQEVVSLGDESEEDVTVEEVVIENKAEDSPKRSRKPRRKATKPEETIEAEKATEAKAPEPEGEAKRDKKPKTAVAGPPKAGTPAPGQSLVDYYKSLALQEASDNDTLMTFRETEEKRTGVEHTGEPMEIEAPVADEQEGEAVEVEIGEDDYSEFSAPQEIPLEWDTHLAEHEIGRDKSAGEPVIDRELESGGDARDIEILDEERPLSELEEQVVSGDKKPQRPTRKRKRGAHAEEGSAVSQDSPPAEREEAPSPDEEEVLIGESESEPEIIEEEESPAMQVEDIAAEVPEGKTAIVEVEEIEAEPFEAEEREEEEAVIEEIVAGDDTGEAASAVPAEPSAEDMASAIEPSGDEVEMPLVEEASAIDEASLPSEEEIEKLLQVTPPSRELSREELLAFDQPTYAKVDSRDASAMPDATEPIDQEVTEVVSDMTSGLTDAEAPDVREEQEVATARTQDTDNDDNGELGRIIQFGKPGSEASVEVILEQPDPIIKSASIDRISTAEDLHVAFDAIRGQTAPEIDTGEEQTVASVIEEVVSVEDIPLVLDVVPPAAAKPEITDELQPPDATADVLDAVGFDQPGANVIPIDAAKFISIAEELDIGGPAAEAPAEPAQQAEAYQAELDAVAKANEVAEPPQAEAYQAELDAVAKANEVAEPQRAAAYDGELDAVAKAAELEAPQQAEAYEAELNADTNVEHEPPADYTEEAYATLTDETYIAEEAKPQVSAETTAEVAAWDTAGAEQTAVQPEPQDVSEFSGQAAEIFADHASEGYVEPPPVPSDEPLPEPVSPEGFDHMETLHELSTEEAETQEEEVAEEPEVEVEQAPTEVQEPEMFSDDLDEDGMMGPLTVSGKRDAGTSLIDLETFELEQELFELAGEGKKKKDHLPINEKPAKKKEKKGRGKSRGKEVDKGSVKKIIDDMKKM